MSEIKAYINPMQRSIDIYVYHDGGYIRSPDGKSIKVEDATEPSYRIPDSFAGALAVAIQEAGLPAGKSYERGKLEALEEHLQDMRKLVFRDKP